MNMRWTARGPVVALVLLAHLLLLWAWPQPHTKQRTPAAPEPMTMAVTLLPAPPTTPAPTPRAADTPVAAQAPPPATRPRRPSSTAPSATTVVEPPRPNEATAAAEPPASSAAPLDLRLTLPRGTAERGGLTEAQNSMRRQALNDPRSNIKPDPTQVLPDAVAASAKGDCLKGEFLGGGMGLLSAPFLAYAAVAGNCKPER
jgi:hypothetical protein